jgi:uncharacterized protein
MGYRTLSLKLPTDFTEEQLRRKISKILRLDEFTYQIERKSLDARKKTDINWQVQIVVSSQAFQGEKRTPSTSLKIAHKTREQKIVVVGSGPAGFFAAFALQKAGYSTTLIERGTDVKTRAAGITDFERGGEFQPTSNYSFGEGGAGTFSDGKLTSRTKNITAEKDFILNNYIKAGAPEEIAYMAHPHVGSDNLRRVVQNLREKFQEIGGTVLFETMLTDIVIKDGRVITAVTSGGELQTDEILFATGHSSYETYKMLIQRGVSFQTKNFAIGYRVEHAQRLINRAQWGRDSLPGVKAAEYRLSSRTADRPVYTFCMCPGGMVVPATAYEGQNIVNGMSFYRRSSKFANAACVAGVHPDELAGKTTTPIEALDWLTELEQKFYALSNNYQAPACSIRNFMNKTDGGATPRTSYSLGLQSAPLWEMLPAVATSAIKIGLEEFNRKLRGFETGMLIGLESKTSAPIQVVRDKRGLCDGFENLYMIGEGSGWAGGIISSGVDGLRAAMSIIARDE